MRPFPKSDGHEIEEEDTQALSQQTVSTHSALVMTEPSSASTTGRVVIHSGGALSARDVSIPSSVVRSCLFSHVVAHESKAMFQVSSKTNNTAARVNLVFEGPLRG